MRELRIGSVETYYRHFNQLIEQGYLSVEQRKADGRFDYCIYRLHEEVLREGMSEKPIHGGKVPENPPTMSEKPVSEKLEHQNFGQANIKNRVISNSSLDNEQEYNHQSSSIFTPEMVKEIIHFDQLQTEVQAWGNILRDTLHGFASPEEERQYQRTMEAVLREIVSQAVVKLCQEKGRERFLEKLGSPVLLEMICRLLVHWREIQNVQGYIAAALKNL